MSVNRVETTSKSGLKDWAKQHFVGFENILMPSFTPDLKDLDEEGIRLDVRQTIKHGCFSTFCVGLSLSPDETRRFYEIVADEAAGKIAIGTPLMAPTAEERKAMADIASNAGVTHMLVHPTHDLRVTTEDELYKYYREIIEYTDLGVALWATDGEQFQNLHPSNVCINVYDRLADLDNVVAVKLMTTLDLPVVHEICERMHDRVLIGGVHMGLMPYLVKHYGMQWSGAWTIEALQTPDQPYVNDYLQNLIKGNEKKAMDLYWHIKPGYDALFRLMAPMLPKGVHPFTHLKYYQWCVGGNGGLLREPWDPHEKDFPLTPEERAHIRAGYKSIDIEPLDDPDDNFIVGRAAYGNGARPGDMAVLNTYIK